MAGKGSQIADKAMAKNQQTRSLKNTIADRNSKSADEALEDSRAQPGHELSEPLPEDHDTPASASEIRSKPIAKDHPKVDSRPDTHELYDEGPPADADQ